MIRYRKITVLLQALISISAATAAVAETNPSVLESQLLLRFKNESIKSDPLGVLHTWTLQNTNSSAAAAAACSWHGVSCNSFNSVTGVDLANLGLSGTLHLDSLFSLPCLHSLNLSLNNFTDNIVSSIPSASLTYLDLSNNSLSGSTPASFTSCTGLIHLGLHANSLSGSLPADISLLRNLEFFALSFNSFHGQLPASILCSCTNLTTLALSLNSFSGPLPPEIGLLRNLQFLWLDGNGFSGSIPAEIGSLTKLMVLSLDSNNFTDTIPASLGRLTSLTILLSLSVNHLSGSIPPELGNLQNLTVLTLKGNNLNGTIPTQLGKMKGLQGLFLEDNLLEGDIPVELLNLSSLQRLSLSRNRLSGTIPDGIGKLYHLTNLNLERNMLEGQIPASLANLTSLQDLALGHNRLSGQIPPSLLSISTMAFSLSMPHNNLSGSIPATIGQMIHVQEIDLSGNNLSGSLPVSIRECLNLINLNLSQNSLTGEIPESLENLELAESLDLSGNSISGKIPSSLANLIHLIFLNLSSNNLTGQIPSSGVFAKMNASSFLSNPGLCGRPLPQACSLNITQPAPKQELKLIFKILIPILSVCVLVTLVALIITICKKRKNTHGASVEAVQSSVWEYNKHLKQYTAEELKASTGNFSNSRIIGTGTGSKVYRASSLQLRLAPKLQKASAAVKVVSKDHLTSFGVELDTLASIRHRNLVKFYGYCDEGQLKAFVLEFLPGGSLQDILYRRDAVPLGLQQRLSIALDVANGLVYLHTSLKLQIVHRDIKPSNILLDEYMVAKVADFGIAKFLDINTVHSTARGTLGYVAPEYSESTRVDAKGDVYSYGVVLLELLTRKSPTDSMFGNMGVSLPCWVRSHFPDKFMEVMDPELINGGDITIADVKVIKGMVEAGLACTEMKPENRPDMETMVRRLTSLVQENQSSVKNS